MKNLSCPARLLMIGITAAAAMGCTPKFNHAPASPLVAKGTFSLTPNYFSLANSGANGVPMTSTHFTMTHVQLGQSIAVTPSSAANFSLNTKPVTP